MAHRLSGEIFIRRTPDDVFDFVADESNEPRYNPAMLHVRTLTDGPAGVGTRYLATMGRGRRRFRMTIEMARYERPSRLASHTTMSLMDVDVDGEASGTRPGGSRTSGRHLSARGHRPGRFESCLEHDGQRRVQGASGEGEPPHRGSGPPPVPAKDSQHGLRCVYLQ